MRHLILGASGQVGEELSKQLLAKREEVIGTVFSTSLYGFNNTQQITNNIPLGKNFILDIRKNKDVVRLIDDIKPEVIYLPAANTNVDYCQEHPVETFETNVSGVKNVVDASNLLKHKPLLVFFSTDYVFDGKEGPYTETDLTNPISQYGQQKLTAEHYLSTQAQKFLIIRTNWVFGNETQGKNFVYRLIQNLKEGKPAAIPEDEFGTPTLAEDLAELTLQLSEKIRYQLSIADTSIVNISGSDFLSKYEFACQIAKIFNLDISLISAVKSEELNRPAKRPLRAGLVVEKITDILSRKPLGSAEALKQMKNDIS